MNGQHPIDLLPDSIRARSQAGLRAGRYVTAGVLTVLLLVAASTHTKLGLERARADLATATEQADLVLATEARANAIIEQITTLREYRQRYRKLALPINLSDLLATIVNGMPPGMTLDRIDLDAGFRRSVRNARSRGGDLSTEIPPRVLTGELSGFAPRDEDIALFVSWLADTPPFEQVSLDFSRTRSVNERSAREFRLSFRVDLDARFVVRERASDGASDGEVRKDDGHED